MKRIDNSGKDKVCDAEVYRSGRVILNLAEKIAAEAGDMKLNIMEVCGGQTYTLARYRLEELLPENIRMIHGPGCPVCVTPAAIIDRAVELALKHDVTICSFGDMLRVPGETSSLLRAKTAGADVRILYSPIEVLRLAREMPEREVVFFAIGFETTTPGYALMIEKARQARLENISLLTSLFTVPPAVRTLKADKECRFDVLLAAGHVCAVSGLTPYRKMAKDLGLPTVVTGFEPADLMNGILTGIRLAKSGVPVVANEYSRVVAENGNQMARELVDRYFEPSDAEWRGLGKIAVSGMKIRPDYEHFDAAVRFNLGDSITDQKPSHSSCIAGRIMKGLALPADCPFFRSGCTPENPLGAPMVSSEGVCAAYHRSQCL